ncbi:MAG: hypothetical protein IPK26_25150 [Planctomycetes bacterium]|nr:hypothetical protein [Planctomycetota bacterium]
MQMQFSATTGALNTPIADLELRLRSPTIAHNNVWLVGGGPNYLKHGSVRGAQRRHDDDSDPRRHQRQHVRG